MNFDFEIILSSAVVICGLIVLFDIFFLSPKRKYASANKAITIKTPVMMEYAREIFPVLLIVFLLRSFLYEPFRIPSGSLKPTLLVGDFILANKFNYGIRLPVFHQKIVTIGEPKHGDIVVFREPTIQARRLIKRVIGLPGDHISYINKILYINGQKIPQAFEKFSMDHDDNLAPWQVEQKQEVFFNIKHSIFHIINREQENFYDIIVPEHKYFMMGDNRDDSADSRTWGFLPEENIIGKANRVLISWDTLQHPLRWDRIGMKIN